MTSPESKQTLRIIDANLNRIGEGLRPSLKSLSPSPFEGEGDKGGEVNKQSLRIIVYRLI